MFLIHLYSHDGRFFSIIADGSVLSKINNRIYKLPKINNQISIIESPHLRLSILLPRSITNELEFNERNNPMSFRQGENRYAKGEPEK